MSKRLNWPEDFINQIVQSDTLSILKQMPDECVDTIITSPPYYGLRDYGPSTNVIWDGEEKCRHDFGEKITKHDNLRYRAGHNTTIGNFKNPDIYSNNKVKTGFCSKCNAWYGQLGLEPTLDLYIKHLLQITAELKRVLKKTGIMFWNHGDSYSVKSTHASKSLSTYYDGISESYGKDSGRKVRSEQGRFQDNIPQKCLTLQNFRLVLEMIQEQGWILRNVIIWHKPNHLPSSVKDRFANAYETVFVLVKSKKYHFDLDAVRVPLKTKKILSGESFNYRVRDAKKKSRQCPQFKASKEEIRRYKTKQDFISQRNGSYNGPLHTKAYDIKGKNPGDVWEIPTRPFPGAHFSTFPEKLIEPMIKAGCPQEICKKCGKARVRRIKRQNVSTGIDTEEFRTQPDPTLRMRLLPEPNQSGAFYSGQTIGWTKCFCKPQEYEPGIVLDPFAGSGTTCKVAQDLGRQFIGIELNPEYANMAKRRVSQQVFKL